VTVLGFAVLAGLVTILTLASSNLPTTLNAYQAGLCLGSLVLEARAVQLPNWGRFSLACVATLTLALSGPNLGGLALALGSLGLLVATSRSSQEGWQADFLALAAACLMSNLTRHPVPVLVCYAICHHYVVRLGARRRLDHPAYFQWLRLQNVILETRLLGYLLFFAVVQASSLQGWVVALLLPLLAAHRAVEHSLFRIQAREASRSLEKVQALQSTLDQVHQMEAASREKLRSNQAENQWLEELNTALAATPSVKDAASTLVTACVKLGNFRSVALYQSDLTLLACHSPVATPQPGCREELVVECQRLQSPRLLTQEHPQRQFAGELAALALPVGSCILYLGRISPPLTEAECRAAMGLSIRVSPLFEKTLQSHRLVGRVNSLGLLLQVSSTLVTSLAEEEIVDRCQSLASSIVPGAAGRLWLEPQVPRCSWGQLAAPDAAGLRRAVHQGQPQILAGERTILLPLISRPGVLEIESHELALNQEVQDTLALFAQQFGQALAKASHVQQLLRTSKIAAIGQLAAGVAHELNTPMGAISLSLESLSSLSLEPSGLKKLQRAERALERCRSIVQKLMIYTRLGDGLEETLDLTQLVRDTLELFRKPLGLEVARLDCQWQEGLWVIGRAQELQQAIVNLLSNAIESYGENAGEVWVGLRTFSSGQEAFVEVADRGCGIPSTDLSRVFEPFFTTKVIGKNIGLGLSVARELAVQYQGDILLQSAPQNGTRATLKLPLQSSPQS